jgi:hypothetical protein
MNIQGCEYALFRGSWTQIRIRVSAKSDAGSPQPGIEVCFFGMSFETDKYKRNNPARSSSH